MKSLFPYAEETRGFIVRVSVSFLPEQSEADKQRWFWAYHIRIENVGDMAAQLLTRHWDISDARGVLVNISASRGSFQLQEMYDVMETIKAFAAESLPVLKAHYKMILPMAETKVKLQDGLASR